MGRAAFVAKRGSICIPPHHAPPEASTGAGMGCISLPLRAYVSLARGAPPLLASIWGRVWATPLSRYLSLSASRARGAPPRAACRTWPCRTCILPATAAC
eukprot:5948553-Prymnesium_polylepis.1